MPTTDTPTETPPQAPADPQLLIAEFDAWREDRADLCAAEDAGTADADDWHASDDRGCDLAQRLADALRLATT